MIALQKLPIPAATQAAIMSNIVNFSQFLIAGETIPEVLKGAYKSKQIKDMLKKETHEKCAYCESHMLHVDYGDVEHIIPKGNHPKLRFDYSNLTLSCGVCNTKKAEHKDILNPYIQDPADHLFACGPMILRRAKSDEGLITQRRLDLNRIPLLERRKERMESIALIADQIARTASAGIRQILIDELKAEALDDREFSMVSRAFVKELCTTLGV